jgi:hypothetical protein
MSRGLGGGRLDRDARLEGAVAAIGVGVPAGGRAALEIRAAEPDPAGATVDDFLSHGGLIFIIPLPPDGIVQSCTVRSAGQDKRIDLSNGQNKPFVLSGG